MKTPYVATIIIPVRNGESFVAESLESIFVQQTNFPYKVIVVDDGSIDNTCAIVSKISKNQSNLILIRASQGGISHALNIGLNNAEGNYVLRHDADDIMIQGRIQHQVDFLEKNPSYALYGGQLEPFGRNELPSPNFYPLTDLEIRKHLRKGNPFAHPTIAINLNYLQDSRYSSDFDGAEDYLLWTEILKTGKAANSEQVLTKYRIHEHQVTSALNKLVEINTVKVQLKYFQDCARTRCYWAGTSSFFYLVLRVARIVVKWGKSGY
jgi:glycosyltransferase involved in cell wall biosynthesis